MAFALKLPKPWSSDGWQAKIRDREGPEEPHVTILFKTSAWRFALRDWKALDAKPPPKEVPDDLRDYVQTQLATLTKEWDAMYPHNPVSSNSASGAKPKRKKK